MKNFIPPISIKWTPYRYAVFLKILKNNQHSIAVVHTSGDFLFSRLNPLGSRMQHKKASMEDIQPTQKMEETPFRIASQIQATQLPLQESMQNKPMHKGEGPQVR